MSNYGLIACCFLLLAFSPHGLAGGDNDDDGDDDVTDSSDATESPDVTGVTYATDVSGATDFTDITGATDTTDEPFTEGSDVTEFTSEVTGLTGFSGSTGEGTTPSEGDQKERGICSFYGKEAQGGLTANGEHFDMNAMTAAHKTLPFGTKIKVTNLQNGKSVVVRINDRGPFVEGRIVDLAEAAFLKVASEKAGLFKCSYVIVAS